MEGFPKQKKTGIQSEDLGRRFTGVYIRTVVKTVPDSESNEEKVRAVKNNDFREAKEGREKRELSR